MHRGSSRWLFVAGALLAVAPVAARAQARGWTNGYFLVGGGVTDFGKSDLRSAFHRGGTWDARLGIGNAWWLGLEASYVGSYRTAAGPGPDLLMNGAEGAVRLQLPLGVPALLVEPFVFGGAGWSHLSLRNAPAGMSTSGDVGVVPFGAGVTLGSGGLLLEARFTYRTTFDEHLPLGAGGSQDLRSWDATANVGFAF